MPDGSDIHSIVERPPGTFFDAETGGPLQLELGRVGVRKYRLRRQFGYQDHRYAEPFICPNDVGSYDTDLASIPWFFSWIVPSRGAHFPAIMLHDALVVGDGDCPTHLGPVVSREEADRIMRDAMGRLGVGFVRRWLAWTGAFLATAAGTMKPRWFWIGRLLVTFGTIIVLGALATLDVFDVFDVLPWMGDRSMIAELVSAAIGAVIIPLLLSVLWWRRWRAAAIGGLTLAVVYHVTIGMFVGWTVYQIVEWLAARVPGLTRPSAKAEAAELALARQERITAQVGKGSSTFIDLKVPRSTLRMTVTGPQMLLSGLRLVTDLGILEGHHHPSLEKLASSLTCTAYCGRTGPTKTEIAVVVDRLGPALVIDVGPQSMYESIIEISTRRHETLEAALNRTIGSGTGRGYLAGLVPVPGQGHPEDLHEAPVTPAASVVFDLTDEELANGNA